jgi:methyltransferase (TIGR00027 family)
MMTPVGLTSRWVAANRSRETESSARLFADPYARSLAGEEGFALLARSEASRPGPPSEKPDPYLSIRTRFFDDALLGAVGERPRAQVVLLAAGMDARAFRLDWPVGVELYEVDRQEVFDHKEVILQDLGARPACTRRVVSADLEGDWIGPLLAAGFDASRPGAFLAEGLLVYLEESAADTLLAGLGRIGRTGSWLGADLVDPSLLASPYFQSFLDELDRIGCPWRFATSEPELFFGRRGWEATVVLPGEAEAHYGRWPYPIAPRNMPGIPRSYFVTARRRADRA